MIHKYKLLDMYIVVDVNSGSVHWVDEEIYNFLDNYNEDGVLDSKADTPENKELIAEIQSLKDDGSLFMKDWHEELAKKKKDSVVKAMCLHVAHDCNLSCEYCFANKGDYSGPKGVMSAEVGKKAIDFIIKSSGKRKNIEIDFFGGEPLMNMDAVREIVEYAEQEAEKHNKNFRFTITTNGILLDEKNKEYINSKMSNIVLSIDGRKQVNDRVRTCINGKGSYDIILPKFIDMAESRGQDNYYVRGTFTKYNKDFAEDVLHLADLGFKQISVEPVVTEAERPYALSEEDLPELFAEYEKLAKAIIKRKEEGKWFNFFHFMIDLEGGPCALKRVSGCGAGHEYVAVTPEGDIYPCHQFVGQEEYKMGSVLDGSFDKEQSKVFEECNLYTKPDCKNCWARFYCSGGCMATSVKYGGGMDKTYKIACELEKKRVECAIALKVLEMSE